MTTSVPTLVNKSVHISSQSRSVPEADVDRLIGRSRYKERHSECADRERAYSGQQVYLATSARKIGPVSKADVASLIDWSRWSSLTVTARLSGAFRTRAATVW